MSDSLHYYLCSYSFPNGDGSIWFGFTNKNITRAKLNEIKEGANESLPNGVTAVVMSISYLGNMTQEEFMDEDTQSS